MAACAPFRAVPGGRAGDLGRVVRKGRVGGPQRPGGWATGAGPGRDGPRNGAVRAVFEFPCRLRFP